jgi:hypothetical protein
MADVALAGTWAYQSYLNTQDQTVFGAGIFTFTTPSPDKIQGTLDMGDDLVLDLDGTVTAASGNLPLTVHIIGNGRPKTKTDGWEYDYHGYLGYMWPNGVDQVPSLVGTIVRAKPHNGSPAGVTASFIAVNLTWTS